MKSVSLGLLVLALSGCSQFAPEEKRICEESLLRGLKSPSSYNRVNWDSVLITKEVEEAADKEMGDLAPSPEGRPKTPYVQVMIEYDADNSYGAAIRDTYFCRFEVDASGKAAPDKKID